MPPSPNRWSILIDVGGVVLREDEGYAARFAAIRRALARRGSAPGDDEFADAIRAAVLSRCPGTHRALVWAFTRPDATAADAVLAEARTELADWNTGDVHQLQPGIAEALPALAADHALGLAANASPHIRQVLDRLGILRHFTHVEVSGDLGLAKPDTRFLDHVLRRCGGSPARAIMVGDRLDNDILCAQLLGLRTIWVRTGLHAALEPREPREIPDRTIASPSRLVEAVSSIVAAADGTPPPDRGAR
ncbi:MAG: HAD family hydrolase [Gemmatimonadota bacterium]